MRVVLENSEARCEIDYHGAELKSFVKNGKEYMWQADPTFWGRTSPVLFPVVGQYANGTFRYQGNEYKMGQHGFARDMDFDLVCSDETSALFRLVSNEESWKKYPLEFELEIGYILEGSKLFVSWNVLNPADEELHFSIGAHPAFNCNLADVELKLFKDGNPVEKYDRHMFADGFFSGTKRTDSLPNGVLPLDEHAFDEDTIAIEDNQVDKVELWTKAGEKQVSVEFDMPLLGLWSPVGKNAPFVCIEPWYGRADKAGFVGELSEREWGNTLQSKDEFNTTYSIEIF